VQFVKYLLRLLNGVGRTVRGPAALPITAGRGRAWSAVTVACPGSVPGAHRSSSRLAAARSATVATAANRTMASGMFGAS
jgi:hypothetical protein